MDEQQFLLNSIPLPPVRLNAPRRLTEITDKSIYQKHLYCLIGDDLNENEPKYIILPKNNKTKLSTFIPYHKRQSQIKNTITKRLTDKALDEHISPSKTIHKSIQLHSVTNKRDSCNTMTNHSKHQRNYSIIQQQNFCSQMKSKCAEVYNNCINLSSSINQLPQAALEVNLKNDNEENCDFLYKLFKPAMKKNHSREIKKQLKIMRETDIISKVSNEFAYDARGVYNDIFLSNQKPITFLQSKETDRTTIRRKTMINAANKIIQSSQCETKKCLEVDDDS